MKCKYCGFESEQDFKFCAKCGSNSSTDQAEPVHAAVVLNPASEKLLPVFNDKSFLALCILMTITAACGIFSAGLPIIDILLAVFLWMTYTKAKNGYVDASHLRCVSGTVYADYIITNVAAIILIVCGVIISVLLSLLTANGDLMREVIRALGSEIPQFYDIYYELPSFLLNGVGIILGGIFVLIGVFGLIINVMGKKKLHRFAKSVYQGVLNYNADFYKPSAIKGWLIFFAVMEIISAASSISANFLAAASAGCAAASCFVSISLIKKHLL